MSIVNETPHRAGRRFALPGAPATDVTVVAQALVLHGHCAQPGENVVDHRLKPVRSADETWDDVWVAPATIAAIPSSSRIAGQWSTTPGGDNPAADLQKRGLSPVSTGLMTTSSRHTTDMTQDVKHPSTSSRRSLSTFIELLIRSNSFAGRGGMA